jgi:Zn-dependent M28 family amino/carboxypeptidase
MISSIEETLTFLTQIEPPRNYKNIASLNQVADFIQSKLEMIGLFVEVQEYEVEGKLYKNIIATLNAHYEKRLIIGGHYDVAGDMQGADDNASAIAGLIESAKKLYALKEELLFRIDFVAFTLEEPPFFGLSTMGSHVHAEFLVKNNIDVIGMINYEMIGYFSDVPNSQEYPLPFMNAVYPSEGNFIAMVSNENSSAFLESFNFEKVNKNIKSINMTLPPLMDMMTASDHINYWKFGYKAIMVTDTAYFRNKNYHTKNDTIDTLDFEKIGFVVELVVSGIQELNAAIKLL